MTSYAAPAAGQAWSNSCPLLPPPSSMNNQAMQAVPLAVEVVPLIKDACLEVVAALRNGGSSAIGESFV